MTGRNHYRRYHRNSGSEGKVSPTPSRCSSPPSNEYNDTSSPIPIPMRSESPSSSDQEEDSSRYAGAKFNSPPPANILPPPPITWLHSPGSVQAHVNLHAMSLHLRQLLKVQS